MAPRAHRRRTFKAVYPSLSGCASFRPAFPRGPNSIPARQRVATVIFRKHAETRNRLGLDEVLDRLAEVDADAARLVKLRYFIGLGMAEAAEAMGISLRQGERLGTFAKAWLRDALRRDRQSSARGQVFAEMLAGFPGPRACRGRQSHERPGPDQTRAAGAGHFPPCCRDWVTGSPGSLPGRGLQTG